MSDDICAGPCPPESGDCMEYGCYLKAQRPAPLSSPNDTPTRETQYETVSQPTLYPGVVLSTTAGGTPEPDLASASIPELAAMLTARYANDTPTVEPDLLRYYAPEPDADADWAIPKLFDAVRSPDDGARAIRIAARLRSTAQGFRPVDEVFAELRAAQPAGERKRCLACEQGCCTKLSHIRSGEFETQDDTAAAGEIVSQVRKVRDRLAWIGAEWIDAALNDAIAWIEAHQCTPMTATLVLRGERDLATLDRIHTIANRAFGEGDDAAKHDALAEILDRIRAVPSTGGGCAMSEKPINAEEVYVNKIEGSPGEFAGGFYEDRPNANYSVTVQPATASEPSEADTSALLELLAAAHWTLKGINRPIEAHTVLMAHSFVHRASRAPLTVSEEVRQRAVKVVWEAGSQTWGESWEDAHALRRPSIVRAGVIVDAVLAVLRAGRSEGDGKP